MTVNFQFGCFAALFAGYIAPSYASAPTAVQPVSAAVFLDSFGVNTHMGAKSKGELDTWYGNPTAIARYLGYVGIRHARDDLSIDSNLSALRQLNAMLGIKFDLCYAEYTSAGGTTKIARAVKNIESNLGMLDAIEGPNEPDIFGLYYNGTYSAPNGSTGAAAVIATQRFLYSTVKSNAHLANVPVYCPAFSYPALAGLTEKTGNLSAYCDIATSHAYPENHSLGTFPTYQYIKEWASYPGLITAPDRPTVITEGGWNTAKNGTTGVDEATQSKYILEYLLDSFSLGISRTYLYELVDDTIDTSLAVDEDNYGLFRYTGTPKASATMLANMNSLLRSASVAPTPLIYSVDNMPANGHQLLLEKSDGTYVLALWNEGNLWDRSTHTEIPIVSVEVLLRLIAPAATVQMFDPIVSVEAQLTRSRIQQLQIMIPDHPILVFIKL